MRERIRLDALLVRRGLFENRSRAAAAVMAGEVSVADVTASKPGSLVLPDVDVSVADAPRYVSRGGLKLERALECFVMPVEGRMCLDVGASTGGFTDCLLRHGAARVTCVDVGYGDLDWRLREDARVTVLERVNARNLESDALPYRPDLIVMDLSFISLGKVLPAVASVAAARFDLLALVKPQFEVGRGKVGKGGVVRDPDDRMEALVGAGEAAREAGLSVQAYCSSGLPGPAGNRESFMWCTEPARAGVEDLPAAARATELEVAPS
ncbi:MAG TPA: TlyA family RNA methyltransferase [Solirubrobacterales bacterium]|nr:TlyA family RNA methyltransferase [Solirubrobacterales bacterium]